MGYYMRYLFEGQPDVGLDALEAALKEIDGGYAFVDWENDRRSAEIRYRDGVYGAFDLEYIEGDGEDEEIQEMIEEVESVTGLFTKKPKQRVLEFLRQVRVRLVVRVLWGGREGNETLDRLNPVWQWLMANYKGLLQADDEGCYEGRKLILKIR